jgi:hypothetical protein
MLYLDTSLLVVALALNQRLIEAGTALGVRVFGV